MGLLNRPRRRVREHASWVGLRCCSPIHREFVCEDTAMGLGAGGKMQQEIYADPYSLEDWDKSNRHRCFIHLCNSMQWRQIAGSNPPQPPLTATEYVRHGIPWFDYYRDDLQVLDGSPALASIKSVAQLSATKGNKVLPDKITIQPEAIVQYGNNRRPNQVREWTS